MAKDYSSIRDAAYQISVEVADKANTQERVGGVLIDIVEKSADVESKKVDKVAGKQLSTEDYTTAEKTKLGGIATGANNYIHPANHAPSIITQDANNRFVSDTEKATWNAKQAALGFVPENVSNKNQANGYAGLDGSGKLPASLLPAIAITDTFIANTEAAMLALNAQVGDICIRTDLSKTYILKTDGAATLANWAMFQTPTDAVTSVAGKTGVVTLTKADVGLNNVDNTADSLKSVASASKLTTARNINGVSFDGTQDITITDNTKEPAIVLGTTAKYYRGDKTWQTLDKSAVGLGNVNNTADADKPISSAVQTALNAKAASSHSHAATDVTQSASYRFVTDTEKATWNGKQAALGFTPENVANKNKANGYAGLGSDGKIDYSLLPAIAIVDTFVCSSQAEMLALTAQRGDVCARTDVSLTYILQGNDPSILSNWQQILAPTGTTGLVQSVNNKVGVVVIDKYDVGLGNVDNTADADKPISSATQTALNGKASSTHGHAAADITQSTTLRFVSDTEKATWNSKQNALSGDVSGHYHSEDRNRANHTGTQSAGTISDFAATVRTTVLTGLSLLTNSAITAADTVLTALGKLQKQITDHAAASNPHGITKTTVGLGSVDNTADSAKNVLSATKLTTARNINGVAFNGTQDITIADGTKEPALGVGTISQYYRGDKTWQTLDKSAVGLGNVDNTADANKSVASAAKLTTARKINGVNFDGSIDITIADGTKEPTIALGTAAQYYRGDKTWQTLNKTAVGLSNVDNTSDASKPISTATQTALNAKAATSHTHSPSDLSSPVTVAKGGTGLNALGTAGQILQTNAAANAMEWVTPRDKGVNTVSTLASLPVTKRLVVATVTAATTLSLAANMEVGDELHVLVYNNSASAITQVLPNTGSFISMSGASISIPAAGWVEINLVCHATSTYILRAGGAS